MKDTYRLNKFGEVAPYIGGIKSNSTREFRSLTGFEAQLVKKNREIEEELKKAIEEREMLIETLKRIIGVFHPTFDYSETMCIYAEEALSTIKGEEPE
jgi:hypothetical protein